ncbi:MAG: DUF4968 domain-containing protein [Solobacterium sp.]|nr:DUF4968 domain-containing protein [Solobacterium sp.]
MKICYRAETVTQQNNWFSVFCDGIEFRIWFLTDDILRIRAGFDKTFDEASYSLVMTAWDSRTDDLMRPERKRIETADAVLTDGPEEAVIQGKHLKAVIHKDPFFISVYDTDGTLIHQDIPELGWREDPNHRRLHTSRIEADDHFYGFGEKTGTLDKAECYMTMAPGDAMGYNAAETDSLYKHIPFYIRLNGSTKKAAGYFYHNTAECSFNMGREKRNYWHRYSTYSTDAGDIDLFLINGPDMHDVIRRYTDLTGKSALLPKAALGYLGSSMYYSELPENCDDGIIRFIDTAGEEDIPIDGFQLSSGYCAVETDEGVKRCTFTWNHQRFKDPAAWFSAMKERGIIVSPNIKPGFLLSHPLLQEMKEKGMFIKADPELPSGSPGSHEGLAVGTWWGGPGLFVDFTDEAVRKQWKEYITSALLQYGCRSIWNDNCEYDSLTDKDSVVSFEGAGSTIGTLRSVMANLMCRLSNEAIEEYDPSVRPFSVCRAGHAGIQRYAQVWAGDNLTSWETLRHNLPTILGMGLSGVANNGCDVGGFYGPAPDPELFVRWVQNGIFMPRFSIHSTNTDNTVTEPWMYTELTPIIREAIDLRYRMMPYLYALEYRAHEEGLPVMEAECLVFQNDPKTYEEDTDFMWGEYMLAANIVEQGQTVRQVYLPKLSGPNERWYDFVTREAFAPGSEISLNVDIRSIPLFVRSGAVIPMSMNRLTNLSTQKTTDMKILFAPDTDSTFTLYEDDGCSNDYREGCFLKTLISVHAGVQTVISFRHEGSYETAVEHLELDVIHREKAPFYVTLDGRELPHFLHRKEYEASSEGWYYSQSLRSVQIRYDHPKTDHEVLISFAQFDLIGM